MIFLKDSTPHLPVEQKTRGGPVRLGLVAIQTSERYELPDVSYVTIPIWDVNTDNIQRGKDVLLIWKILDGLSSVDADATYSNLNSNYLSTDWIQGNSQSFWNKYASGRWSVLQADFSHTNVSTWHDVPVQNAESFYNPLIHGGHVGLLYFRNWNGNPIRIPGSFGRNGGYLEWMVCAEVVGSVIQPTRTISGLNDGIMKKITKTTSGVATAANISNMPINSGTMSFKNDPDIGIAETLNIIDEESSVIFMPCGIDSFPETNGIRFYRPGSAIPVVMYGYTGPKGFSGDMVAGTAFSASIKFIQTRRAA